MIIWWSCDRHVIIKRLSYGWHCPGRIFSQKVVTFFETLAAVFGHFLHWVICFNWFFWSIRPAAVRKTNFQTCHLMWGTWKLPPNMGGFEVFSHFFFFCIIFLCFRIKSKPSRTFFCSSFNYRNPFSCCSSFLVSFIKAMLLLCSAIYGTLIEITKNLTVVMTP